MKISIKSLSRTSYVPFHCVHLANLHTEDYTAPDVIFLDEIDRAQYPIVPKTLHYLLRTGFVRKAQSCISINRSRGKMCAETSAVLCFLEASSIKLRY